MEGMARSKAKEGDDDAREASGREAPRTDDDVDADATSTKAGDEREATPTTGKSVEHKEGGGEGEGEEEEETCGFCKFMKGGACKDVFVAWEECVDSCRDKEGGDFVENCLNQTKLLKECMEENAEYYGIMLQAEEESLAAREEAAEKASEDDQSKDQPEAE